MKDYIFQIWATKCRLEKGLKFHTNRCRYTMGTQLLQKGVPLDWVQEVLGHKNISTTRHYAKTALEAVLELTAKPDRVKENKSINRYLL